MERPKKDILKGFVERSTKQYSRAQDLYIDYLEKQQGINKCKCK
jgi:hypothetical protein